MFHFDDYLVVSKDINLYMCITKKISIKISKYNKMSTQENFMIIDQNHLNWRRNSLTVFFILSNLIYLEKGNIHFTVWQHSMWQYTPQLYKNMNDYYPTNCIANKCRIISPLIKLTTNSYSPVHSKIRQHYQDYEWIQLY